MARSQAAATAEAPAGPRAPGMRQAGPARLGVDILWADELDRLWPRPWFQHHMFAAAERAEAATLGADRAREFLAGRFAAKEAILKLLGHGLFDGVFPRDIAVLREPGGAPAVTLSGTALRAARADGVVDVRVSITHKDTLVAAVATGWVDLPPAPRGPDVAPSSPAAAETDTLEADTDTDAAELTRALRAAVTDLPVDALTWAVRCALDSVELLLRARSEPGSRERLLEAVAASRAVVAAVSFAAQAPTPSASAPRPWAAVLSEAAVGELSRAVADAPRRSPSSSPSSSPSKSAAQAPNPEEPS
ncbi:holo-ACP synthase [Catenulispora sp. NF23]|uniref:holo-ACP synthase n=1 Tax=Catenulispora pinistramenti TaxID=2705254 RepID=UPI001BAD4283|nr:holo-ACP synthase [Catenulispora pinistramenti]MBS2532720.1 holo-ACP synthase [Catenulispora pinistramenti]